VLDLSKSMRVSEHGGEGNDPGGMAILSTLLLYDLAHPDISKGDSFEVIPFAPHWRWNDPAKSPPTDNGPIIEAQSKSGRVGFASKVLALQYEANCTHFYPGLRAAVNDLTSAGKADDTRTVVLLTDGLPDNPCDRKAGRPTRETEKDRIERDLLPLMKNRGIRLYVLAFGPKVDEDFFRTMAGDSGGKVFIEAKGEDLLSGMLDLFKESFGYEVDPSPPQRTLLQLTSGARIPRAAVVVFNPRSSAGPAFVPNTTLTAPSGGALNLQDNKFHSGKAPEIKNVANARMGDSGAAYALGWILNPETGNYQLSSGITQGSVAVLRPVTATLEIVPLDPSKNLPTDVMADTKLPMQLKAANQLGGSLGNEVTIQYQLTGENNKLLSDHPDAPVKSKSSGTLFTLLSKFPDLGKTYTGAIQAKAFKNNISLAELAIPYKVTVHPYLFIAPIPPTENVGKALGKGESFCSRPFKLEKQGILPKPRASHERYVIKATLDFHDADAIGKGFNGASFTLDGESLQFDDRASPSSPSHTSGPPPGAWYKGRELKESELLGEHELCVKIGRPKSGNPTTPLNLPVHFVLAQSPYDDFDVIQLYTLRITLDKTSEAWSEGVLLSLLGLLALASLWYLRDRPALAPDLGFAAAPDGSTAPLSPKPLGEASPLARLLGLPAEKPVILDSGDPPLAWVKPLDGELYRLRLRKGSRLEVEETGEPVTLDRHQATVAVHRTYRLRTAGGGVYLLRLQYR
jgi:hypothetical protein